MSAARLLTDAVPTQMTVDEVRRRGTPVLCAFPRLIVDGWYLGRAPARDRDFDYEQVLTAVLFLRAFGRRRRTFNDKAYSYGLKHYAENWGAQNGLSPYVSNGALILAALLCGYKFRPCPGSLNCTFDMSVTAEMRRYDRPASLTQ